MTTNGKPKAAAASKAATPQIPTTGRRYSAKPAKGQIESALERIDNPADRRRQRHQRIKDAITNFPEFTLGGLRIVPTAPPFIDAETGMIEIRCFIFNAATGEEIEHPDGRFQFDRPPYLAHDGSWRKEGDRIRPNLREDPLKAMQANLVILIRNSLRLDIPEEVAPGEHERFVTDSMGFRITNSGKVIAPPEVDGRIAPYGDPPAGETWKERE